MGQVTSVPAGDLPTEGPERRRYGAPAGLWTPVFAPPLSRRRGRKARAADGPLLLESGLVRAARPGPFRLWHTCGTPRCRTGDARA
ncbi:hypothetical protein GCM10009801_53630 [Streptomyces albiaxialis]|uniref:Uncharacterized protein n=1 Tax=Streptomyces albiaxialis TaxID=329523 RepID=A0ABP5HXS6_9ACTN